jgi:outer membrane receptor protein involved in Fe transport
MKVKSLKLLLTAVMGLLFVSNLALAGTTGKISGVVLDGESNEPLPGAVVMVLGTSLGANTDLDGRFTIINVPVGTYSVQAKMMGYETQTIMNLKSIMDLTTVANFKLKTEIIKGQEIVVTAQRGNTAVIRDITSTTKTVSTKEIENMAGVRSYADVVARQSGVVSSSGGGSGATAGLHVRGGRSNEIAYFVDGLSTQDQVTGGSGAQINTNAIQEVMVITGGFNAEYGQAMSGVVNVVTKSGSNKTEGMVRYKTNSIFSEDDVVNRDYDGLEANVGGPIPFLKDFKYFVSGETYRYGYDRQWYFYPNSKREFYSGQAKLTMDKNTFKVTVGGFLSRLQFGIAQGWLRNHDFDYNSGHNQSRLQKSQQLQATVTHMLTKSLFYTANIAYFSTRTKVGVRKYSEEGYEGWFSDYQFKEFYSHTWFTDPTNLYYNGDTTDGYITHSSTDPTVNPYGITGFFFTGDYPFPSERKTEYALGRFDITSQVNQMHQLKAGTEVKFNTVEYFRVSYPASSYIDEITGLPSYLYRPDIYKYYPFQANAYVQDKMEFQGLIVNAGIRMDLLAPHANRPTDYEVLDAYDSLNPTAPHVEFIDSETKIKISPRLGISFPITERTAFRFSYGHFFQSPDLMYLYASINNTTTQNFSFLGNPDLNAQQTVAFEIGLQHQFTPDLLLNITSYYKDIYHLLGQEKVFIPKGSYYLYKDTEYGNVKGIELQMNAQISRILSARLGYGLSVARGSSSYPTELYAYQYASNTEWVPVQDYYLEFDQRHNIAGEVSIYLEKGDGPKIFGFRPLENINANIATNLSSGLPYTKTNSKGQKIEITNSSRLPWNTSTSLRISRDFSFWRMSWGLVLEVENLFNKKNIVSVWTNTGLADNNGALEDGTLNAYKTGILRYLNNDPRQPNPEYNYRADLNHDDYISAEEHYLAAIKSNDELARHGQNSYPYDMGRDIKLGLSLNF